MTPESPEPAQSYSSYVDDGVAPTDDGHGLVFVLNRGGEGEEEANEGESDDGDGGGGSSVVGDESRESSWSES